jgi:hypothetical protein
MEKQHFSATGPFRPPCSQSMMDIAPIEQDVILGKPWLTQHNPNIDWTTNTVRLLHQGQPIQWTANSPPTNKISLLSALQFKKLVKKERPPIHLVCLHEANADTDANSQQGTDTRIKNLLEEFTMSSHKRCPSVCHPKETSRTKSWNYTAIP